MLKCYNSALHHPSPFSAASPSAVRFRSAGAPAAVGGNILNKNFANLSLFCFSDLSGSPQGANVGSVKATLVFFFGLYFFNGAFHIQLHKAFHLHRLSGNGAGTSAAGLGAVQL